MNSALRVLITGANGQVATALCETCPPNIELTALGRRELDIANPDSIQLYMDKIQPDVVINTAAYTAVDKAESESEAAQRVNAEGPRLLAQAVKQAGRCRLLHVSTDFVFDGRSVDPYRPESPVNPLGVYGRTKARGERAVLETVGDRSVIVRTAWVYARQGNNFVKTMLRLMGERGAVRVVSDQIGTPTAAVSLAALLWSLAVKPQVSGILHWTDAGVASWYDFAVAIAEEGTARGLLPRGVQVTPITSVEYPTPARRPAYSVLDKSAATAATGIAPLHWRVNLRAVIEAMSHG